MTDEAIEIMERIRAAAEAGTAPEGVLFHGSGEPVAGPLEVGGDGVLWTSDSPVIAQQYIPSSGIVSISAVPMAYELSMKVKPATSSPFYLIAKAMTGLEIDDVEHDRHGNLSSWRVPPGWPTYEEVIGYARDVLGYAPGRYDTFGFKTRFAEGGEEVLPARWKLQGTLHMALSDGLRFKDIRRGDESDLSDLEYHDIEAFMQANDEGYDGVIINDFAQTDNYGNLGHVSYGLTPAGMSRTQWVSAPAVRFDLEEISPFPVMTPDLLQWISSAPGRSFAP